MELSKNVKMLFFDFLKNLAICKIVFVMLSAPRVYPPSPFFFFTA